MEWQDVSKLNDQTQMPPLSFIQPDIDDVDKMYNPPPCAFSSGGDGPVIVLATASYSGISPECWSAWNRLIARTCWDFGEGNVWITPTGERLPYPYAPLFALCSAFKTEVATGRKFDWMLWVDDDVLIPSTVIRRLIASADPTERPFVATVGYDRSPPFRPAIWDRAEVGDCVTKIQWTTGKEGTGLHLVDVTGLCCAIFHRSFFDRVSQPWFASTPGEMDDKFGIAYRGNPDAWLCQRCRESGVPVYVDTDIEIAHMGQRIPICGATVDGLRQVFAFRETINA